MSPNKILMLALSASLTAAPISQAFADEYPLIPDSDFSQVSKVQGAGVGADAVAAYVIWKLSQSRTPQSAKNLAAMERLSQQQTDLVLELDGYNRQVVGDSVEYRQRLNDIYAAYSSNAEIVELRNAGQALDIAKASGGDVTAAQAAVDAASDKLDAKLASLKTAEGAPVETSLERVWNVGTSKNSDALLAEYETLAANYSAAEANGSMEAEIAKMQKNASAGIAKANPKLENVNAKIASVASKSGALKRFLVGPLLKLTSLAFIYDGASRGYTVFSAHRDPGMSPAVDKIKAALGK